jgi:replication initiator protein
VAAQAASLQATKFNERLKPYILGLRKHFAKIPVAEACKLRSGHAISFYLYCWSWYTSHERGWSMRMEQLIGEGMLERTGNRIDVVDLDDESLVWLLSYQEVQKAGIRFS